MDNNQQFEKPEIYRIKIKGLLDEKWSDWFDGFTITPQEDETILVGSVSDQGALHGLLAKIRDLGLILISIEQHKQQDSQNKCHPEEPHEK